MGDGRLLLKFNHIVDSATFCKSVLSIRNRKDGFLCGQGRHSTVILFLCVCGSNKVEDLGKSLRVPIGYSGGQQGKHLSWVSRSITFGKIFFCWFAVSSSSVAFSFRRGAALKGLLRRWYRKRLSSVECFRPLCSTR